MPGEICIRKLSANTNLVYGRQSRRNTAIDVQQFWCKPRVFEETWEFGSREFFLRSNVDAAVKTPGGPESCENISSARLLGIPFSRRAQCSYWRIHPLRPPYLHLALWNNQ